MGELQIALGAPHDLMMFSTNSGDPMQQDIYIGLPSATLLSASPVLSRSSDQACLTFSLL
jgi:hypothetical protein